MAQDVKIAGATYSDVPAVTLPKADNSGNARFTDTSDATATADKILQGFTAYGSSGTKLTGTAQSGGGGGTDHDFVVTAELDYEHMTLSNASATLAEIGAAKEANKDVRMDVMFSYEGFITIVFSAFLTEYSKVKQSGDDYYQVVFAGSNINDNVITYGFIVSSGAGDNDDYELIQFPEPARQIIDITLNNNLEITSVSGFDLDRIVDSLGRGYYDRVSVTLVDANGSRTPTEITCADSTNGYVRCEGETSGITCACEMQIYDEEPSVYNVECTLNGNTVYLGFTLDFSFANIEYIRVYADLQILADGTVQTTVTNATLPQLFLQKMQLLLEKYQLSNIKIVLYVRPSGGIGYDVYELPYLHMLRNGLAEIEAEICSPNTDGSITSLKVGLSVTATEPLTGYYIEIASGVYLLFRTEINTSGTKIVHATVGTGVRNVTTFTINDETLAGIVLARSQGKFVWLHAFVSEDYYYDGMDKYIALPLTSAQTTDNYTELIFSGYADLGDGPVNMVLVFENSVTTTFDVE